MSVLSEILSNEYIVSGVIAGISWLGAKLWGKRKDTKLAKVTTALATSTALMTQYALTEKGKTAKEVIVAFKGIVAMQLARVGVYEKDRAPYQYLIDRAISEAVTRWVEAQPAPSKLTMPIVAKLATKVEVAEALK